MFSPDSKIRAFFVAARSTIQRTKRRPSVTSVQLIEQEVSETQGRTPSESTNPNNHDNPLARHSEEPPSHPSTTENQTYDIVSIATGGDMLALPEYLRQNQNVMNIMSLVRSKRAERSVLKHLAENRVRLCEGHLEALRKELLDADKNLQEVDKCISDLRQAFLQAPPPDGTSLDHLPFNPAQTSLLSNYESDSSEDSGSGKA